MRPSLKQQGRPAVGRPIAVGWSPPLGGGGLWGLEGQVVLVLLKGGPIVASADGSGLAGRLGGLVLALPLSLAATPR